MAQAMDTQVMRLLSQHDIVYLQEVRGAHDVVTRAICRTAATHTGWTSTRGDRTAGGVAILASKSLAAQATTITAAELVRGRILRLSLARGDEDRIDLVHVHNEGLSRADRAAVLADFRSTARLRHAARLVCGGDFNFDAAHSEVTHITAAGRVHTHPRTRDRARWAGILTTLLEASPEMETRFAPAGGPAAPEGALATDGVDGTSSLVGSTIDLWFIDVHPLLAPRMCIQGKVSDHVPITLALRPRPPKAEEHRPISHWLAGHLVFERRLASLTAARSWDLLHTKNALRHFKQAMHSAARFTLKAIMSRRAVSTA